MDSTREVAIAKRSCYHGDSSNVATAQFGGGIDAHTPLTLLFPIGFKGEFRDFYTLGNPSFGVPVQRSEQHNLAVSGGLVVHF